MHQNATHGASASRLYRVWIAMRQRCYDPLNKRFPQYGGRGITVCPAWNDFEVFRRDVGDRPSASHTLDRRDNNGNYEPGNVRWATAQEQARNRRTSLMVTAWGETKTLAEWAEDPRCAVAYATLQYRIARAPVSAEDAISLSRLPSNRGPHARQPSKHV